MIPFSLAFLVPVVLATVTSPDQPGWWWALVPAGAAFACVWWRRTRALLATIVAGLLLFLLRGTEVPNRHAFLAPPGVSIPVTVEAEVAAPPYRRGKRCIIPLAGAPALTVHTPALGPLPGTFVRARGRLEAHGRRISLPGIGALTIVKPPPPGHPGALLESIRRSLRERLHEGLSPRTRAFLLTLLLGDRSLTRRDRDRLARTGTLHLFALSGLHLAVFLSLLRRGLGAWNTPLLFLLLIYAMLTGFRSPMGRAFFLEAGALLGQRLGRRSPRGAHLLLAMTLLLAFDRGQIRSVGFLLSFSAYSGIRFLALPLLDRRRGDPLRLIDTSRGARLARLLEAPFLVSVMAFVTSLPVTVAVFHRASWTAIPGSILLGPAVPILLLTGLVLMLIPGFPPAVAIAEASVDVLNVGLRGLDLLPGSPLIVPMPHAAALGGLALACVFLGWRLTRGRPVRGAATLVAVFVVLLAVPAPVSPGFTHLDAGRGSALLVTTDHEIWLFDCGPRESRVADQILALGISRLDGLVISHMQEDHAGGLRDVTRHLEPAIVCLPPCEEEASPSPTAAQRYSRGARLQGADVGIEFLWPEPGQLLPSKNDRSLVARVTTSTGSVLALGDLESRGLSAMLDAESPPPTDILIAPHHGAHNRSLVDLLLHITPDEVWISARAGFPDEGTMLLLFQSGLRYRGTWGNSPIGRR